VDIAQPDIACIGNLLHFGELLVTDINGNPTTSNSYNEYTFEWYEGNSATGTLISNQYDPTGLSAHDSAQAYTVLVTDTTGANLGCYSQRALTLPKGKQVIGLYETVFDNTICSDINSRVVLDSIITDIPDSVYKPSYAGSFDVVKVFDVNRNIIAPGPATWLGYDPVSGTVQKIVPGSYYISAISNLTNCESGLKQVIIDDKALKPKINLSLVQEDISCPGGTPTGAISVVAEGGSDSDATPGNFIYEWSQANTLGPVDTSFSSPPNAINLASGNYTIRVTDRSSLDSACFSTATFDVPTNPIDIAPYLAPTDQLTCRDNGTVQVDSVVVGTTNKTPAYGSDLSFILLNSDLASSNFTFNSSTGTYINVDPGTYFMQAIDLNTNCVSQLTQVTVQDLAPYPVPTITLDSAQYSLNPDPSTWTGQLHAQAINTDGNDASPYNYVWHVGSDTADISSIIDLDSIVTMRDKGVHTLKVTDPNTGCIGTAAYDIPLIILEPTFTYVADSMTTCIPPDGAITLEDVFLDGVPDEWKDYSVMVYYGQYKYGNATDSIIGTDPNTIFANLNAGTYYIDIFENRWWLRSRVTKIEIGNKVNYPEIGINNDISRDFTSCDTLLPNGILGVQISNGGLIETNPDQYYDFRWYDGNNVLIGPDSSVITGLGPGTYKVEVIETLTKCGTEKLLPVRENVKVPVVAALSTPMEYCYPSGTLQAYELYTEAGEQTRSFKFTWFKEDGTFFRDGNIIDSVKYGLYKVIATSLNGSTCVSDTVMAIVDDERTYPVLYQDNSTPITACVDSLADAFASFKVILDGDTTIAGHTFEWYDENDSLYSNSPIANKLMYKNYHLIVANNVSQCATDSLYKPLQAFEQVPPPDAFVLQHRTDCLEPNGIATASINNDILGYSYVYVDPDTVELPNEIDNYNVIKLDVGQYYAYGISLSSGCKSPLTPFTVVDSTYYPDFEIVPTPSLCTEPTGTAMVIISDPTRTGSIVWYLNGAELDNQEGGGANVFGLYPTDEYTNYEVEVEGSPNCTTIEPVKVGTDIIVYNGMSPNNDQLNDFFMIQCIDKLPNNNVKIFNRKGVQIYEIDYYDQNDDARRFNGIANRGALGNGNTLPIGTYFYIIDKGDGSEPIVGYLELNK